MNTKLAPYDPHPNTGENMKDLGVELAILRSTYPQLRKEDIDRGFFERISRRQVVLPFGAERWTLLPMWNIVAPSYGRAVEKNHSSLEKKAGEINYQLLALKEKKKNEYFSNIRESDRSRDYFGEIAGKQGNHKIIVVPVQFGSHYAGRPVSRMREEMDPHEFGLGSFAGSIFLLTHPERLAGDEDPWFDCIGDEIPQCKEYAPFYGRTGKNLRYGIGHIGDSHSFCGAATGFVPTF